MKTEKLQTNPNFMVFLWENTQKSPTNPMINTPFLHLQNCSPLLVRFATSGGLAPARFAEPMQLGAIGSVAGIASEGTGGQPQLSTFKARSNVNFTSLENKTLI